MSENVAAQLQRATEFEFLSHRQWHPLLDVAAGTFDGRPIPEGLVTRVITAYRAANALDHNGVSQWTDFFNTKHQDSHAALMRGDVPQVTQTWSNPADNYSFWGFDELHPDYSNPRRSDPTAREIAGHRVYDNLLQFGAATGVVPIENPEAPRVPSLSAEKVLDRLDEAMGFRIDFPNLYPAEFGLVTSRGVASYRAIQALFQAYQTKKLLAGGSRVLEIGPGLGRAAYYCVKAGITDYTLIDLPFSNVSQAFFLGGALGPEAVQLTGEAQSALIKIKTPDVFLNGLDRYDLVVNFDSLTEMDPLTQRAYVAKIKECVDVFLSVNHEYNEVTVASLLREIFPGKAASRDPYWMRRGYVQEIMRIK